MDEGRWRTRSHDEGAVSSVENGRRQLGMAVEICLGCCRVYGGRERDASVAGLKTGRPQVGFEANADLRPMSSIKKRGKPISPGTPSPRMVSTSTCAGLPRDPPDNWRSAARGLKSALRWTGRRPGNGA